MLMMILITNSEGFDVVSETGFDRKNINKLLRSMPLGLGGLGIKCCFNVPKRNFRIYI